MHKIMTADNTETFLNTEVGESYHSQTGAVEEALKKYANPCKIAEKAKAGTIKILDMFFGLGYNSAMAIDVALEANPNCEIEITGLEYDPNIIQKIQEVNPPINSYKIYKQLTNNKIIQHNNITIKLIIGDARETIKQFKDEHFDAVFFDPFSPKTAPDMWTQELFTEVHRVMNSSAIMATYSCARMARENMKAAGLFYDEGPVVGRRGPGTIATKWD